MPIFIFLLIEFLGELIFCVTGAAWPLIRIDLHLNYIQIGLPEKYQTRAEARA